MFLVLSRFKLDKIKVANWKPETRTEKDQIGYRYLRCNLGTERYDTIRHDREWTKHRPNTADHEAQSRWSAPRDEEKTRMLRTTPEDWEEQKSRSDGIEGS